MISLGRITREEVVTSLASTFVPSKVVQLFGEAEASVVEVVALMNWFNASSKISLVSENCNERK